MVVQEEFKFPDEQVEAPAENAAQVEELKIEVVDDTPPEDRNRVPLPKKIVEELENDDLEEYSEKVKKRLGQMKKVWHDERRAKEATAREKEEALRFAQQVYEENKALKQRLGSGEQAYAKIYSDSATKDLAVAKEKIRRAYEAGDAEQIAEAQVELTEAQVRLREVEKFRPTLQTETDGVQNKQQIRQQPQPQLADPRAQAWREANTWFGTNKSMTALALGLHEEMMESGINPRSDEYYDKLNRTMRKRFPEAFEDEAEQTVREDKPARTQKAANVVAPATRSTAPRQVRLTPTQVALAKKLGLSNEQYARELMKLEAN